MPKKKYPTLLTPYAESARDIPWDEYPRPQFKRDSFLCLNGQWDFEVCNDACVPNKFQKKILVPFPPESYLSNIERRIKKGEYMFYHRTFTLPDNFLKDRLILHFGAVDQICTVFVNGNEIFTHEGGYIPFSIDITDATDPTGENEILLKARDDLSLIYPYGKQKNKRGGMWYTPVSGIWQTVWLESTPKKHIESIRITPTAKNVKIEVKTEADRKTLKLRDSNTTYEFSGNEITLVPDEVHLWSPDDPYLYYFTVETENDRIESYFALREIGIDDVNGIKRLTLNGKPYIFNGLLDQGYFPDGIFLPPTSQGYLDDIKLAKDLGFNMLRKHIKIEPLVFYHLCDKLGIVVFQDMVNNSDYSFFRDTALPTIGIQKLNDKYLHRNKKSREIFENTMNETLVHLYNSPCVLLYTIFNEGWGQFDSDEAYKTAKHTDPTRLYDSTSGWFTRKLSDLDSKHIYFKELKVNNISSDKPVFISEFGGYSHRVDGHLFGERNYGYKQFTRLEDFEEALIKLYEREVLPVAAKCASAFVYTQLSDVEDETNGLVTYDRRFVKISSQKFKDLMHKISGCITK